MLKNLEWVKKLDGKIPLDAVVVSDSSEVVWDVADKATGLFRSVCTHLYSQYEGDPSWPRIQNYAWKQAARYVRQTRGYNGWFWWEADATPLKAGWWKAIEEAHVAGGKPFTGHFVESMGHMTGVGVYPWNVDAFAPRVFLAEAAPFDVALSKEGVSEDQIHKINHLIQHVWNVGGAPASFSDADSMRLIQESAVIFHRCKDGSLIDVLEGGAKPTVGPHTEGISTAIVQLGRYGDIINILPIAEHICMQTGKKVAIVVSEEFADTLDGVSYALPHYFKGHYSELESAVRQVSGLYERVIVSQVYGKATAFERRCDSFAKESWNRAGFLPYWGKLPLTFDQRDPKREAELLDKTVVGGKPLILVNVTGGKSSPLEGGMDLLHDIQARWAERAEIVDLEGMRVDRFYDLLALYDKAKLLITNDTATLHLSKASTKLRVCALITDKPTHWHGSPFEGIRYSELPQRREEIHAKIAKAVNADSTFHVYCDYKGSEDAQRRNALALSTRLKVYGKLRAFPVRDEQLPRLFNDGKRKLPYLRDLINFAFDNGATKIILTNADTCFAPSFLKLIEKVKLGHGGRRDFKRLDTVLTDEEVANGHAYCGGDLFIFTEDWWSEHNHEMPDMLIGTEGWDCVLRHLIIETGGVEVKNAIYHERHASVWESAENRYTLSSQHRNIELAKVFLMMKGVDPTIHGFK